MNPEQTVKPEFTKKPEFMRLAAEQKQTDLPLLSELLRFFLVVLAGMMASVVLGSIPLTLWGLSGERGMRLLQAYMDGEDYIEVFLDIFAQMPLWLTAVIVAMNALLGVAAAIYCTRVEKRSLATMGLVRRHALSSYALGAVLGAVSFAATAGLACAFGGVSVTGMQPFAALWPTLLMMLFAYVLQSAGEELLLRGYLMTSLSQKLRLPACVCLSSILFGMLHGGNIGIQPLAFVNIALVGAVLGLYVLLTGDLWGACGYHALWNFIQGNIFGLSVSGMPAQNSLLTVEVRGHSELLTGGVFGLEGSLCATLVLLAELGVLIFLLYRRPPEESSQ